MLEPNIKNVKRLWCDVFVIELFFQNSYFELLSYFEKIAHMSVVWAYVSLWLRVFVCSDFC